MVNFEDGTLLKGAYVVINGTEYPVVMPEYSGTTPINAENLNKLQTDILNNLGKGKVLWHNEGNTSLSPQTISIPMLSTYDYIIVFAFRNKALDSRALSILMEVNIDIPSELKYTDYSSGNVRSWFRRIDVSINGLDVGAGYINGDVNNNVLIPYKVVGFKYAS